MTWRWLIRAAFALLMAYDLIHGYPGVVYVSVTFMWLLAEWGFWYSLRTSARENNQR